MGPVAGRGEGGESAVEVIVYGREWTHAAKREKYRECCVSPEVRIARLHRISLTAPRVVLPGLPVCDGVLPPNFFRFAHLSSLPFRACAVNMMDAFLLGPHSHQR